MMRVSEIDTPKENGIRASRGDRAFARVNYILLTIFGSEAAIQKVQGLNSIELFFSMTGITALTAVISFVLFLKKDKSQIKSV